MSKRAIAGALLLLVAATGCAGLVGETREPRLAAQGPDLSLDDGSFSGNPTARCVDGWTTPANGSALWDDALRLIRRRMRAQAPFEVREMRYFTGPESPPSGEGYFQVVERWYVRGQLGADPGFRARWLVERRVHGAGVAAVAPHDTSGYRSPDWTAFQYEFADPERREYPGLPGTWAGTPYDFVRGSRELDIQIPGLPQAVTGCLAGT
ncbi:MAG TPA: hypothetical protein VGB51_05815 [Actinomycetota bacterium]